MIGARARNQIRGKSSIQLINSRSTAYIASMDKSSVQIEAYSTDSSEQQGKDWGFAFRIFVFEFEFFCLECLKGLKSSKKRTEQWALVTH